VRKKKIERRRKKLQGKNIMAPLLHRAAIITVVQQHRLRWNRHVLRKDDNYWVKKCMDYEVKTYYLEAGQRKT